MKKILQVFRAWLRGEEIEAEFALPVLPLLLIGGVVLFFILKACL
jgi:hypothetical protein